LFITLTDDGITMDFNPMQPEKQDSPIEFMVAGIVFKTSAVQPEKADLPKETIELEKLKEANLEQPENNPSSIPDKAVGKLTEVRLLQFWNK
jgi:hypothetical protein